jgi:hypothetical protein
LRLVDLITEEPQPRQNSILDVTIEVAGLELLLPVQFVRTQLGPNPGSWGRTFAVRLLQFSEDEYQGIKTGSRPELLRVLGGKRVKFAFGPVGWERVAKKELSFDMEQLRLDALTEFKIISK